MPQLDSSSDNSATAATGGFDQASTALSRATLYHSVPEDLSNSGGADVTDDEQQHLVYHSIPDGLAIGSVMIKDPDQDVDEEDAALRPWNSAESLQEAAKNVDQNEGQEALLWKLKRLAERQNSDLFNAIIEGDTVVLFNILHQLRGEELLQAVNEIRHEDIQCRGYSVLQLCYVMGRFKLANILQDKYGGDLHHVSKGKKNMLHVVVDLGKERPERAQRLRDLVLDHAQPAQLRALMESSFLGHDPLVYAVLHGDVTSADVMLRTGTFREELKRHGLYAQVRYDLSAYEEAPHSELRFSPLRALLGLREHHIEREETRATLRSEFWTRWIERKWSAHARVVMLWFGLKLLHLSVMTAICLTRPPTIFQSLVNATEYVEEAVSDVVNRTGEQANEVLMHVSDSYHEADNKHSYIWWTLAEVFLLIMSFLCLLMEGLRLFTKKNLKFILDLTFFWWRHLREMNRSLGQINKPREVQVLHGRVFWFINLMMHLLVIVSFIVRFVGSNADATTLALAVCCGYLTLVEFSYLLPKLGHFAIVVERTLTDIFHFGFFFAAVILGVGAAFFVLFQDSQVAEHRHLFSSYSRTLFQLFHMTFSPLETDLLYASPWPVVTIALFVLYIILVVILLLNFLIAVMNQTVDNLNQSKDVIFFLNRLNIAYFLENITALRWFRAAYKRRCQKNKENPPDYTFLNVIEAVDDDKEDDDEPYPNAHDKPVIMPKEQKLRGPIAAARSLFSEA